MNRNNQGKTLYLDCSGGISGDMTVAALLDLGADKEALMSALASLPEECGFQTKISRVKKSGIDCCDFSVILENDNHDHDMNYLYGHTHGDKSENPSEAGHTHSYEHAYGDRSAGESESVHIHSHAHTHGDGSQNPSETGHIHSHEYEHEHRNLKDIEQILADCEMSDRALELAGRIFEILAEAESKAHGVPVSQVHFHEVGAIDSIVDIISIAVCFDSLGINEVIVPRLAEGYGTVRTQHGVLPIPVPAVLNIAEQHGLNLEIQQAKGEYVTPTGAAFCAAVMTSDRLPERFRVIRTGLGAGKRKQELPGILRAMLIEAAETKHSAESAETGRLTDMSADGMDLFAHDCIWKLETQLDDCSGEILGYITDKVLDAGALDIYHTPIYMKKNRPGVLLTVLCPESVRMEIESILFLESTTIGIRRIEMERDILKREADTVLTPYGEVAVKIVHIGRRSKLYPEYESAKLAAEKNGVSLSDVYQSVQAAAAE